MMKRLMLLLFANVLVCASVFSQKVESADQLLKHADQCFEQQDYDQAVRLYKLSTIAGNIEAQNKLGFCYMYGTGVMKSSILAVGCFKKAAEKGYAKAQFNLSNCYYMGQGVAVNYKKSAEWLLKAAEQRYEPAMQNMSSYYRRGIGVMIDSVQANLWDKKWREVVIEESKAMAAVAQGNSQPVVSEPQQPHSIQQPAVQPQVAATPASQQVAAVPATQSPSQPAPQSSSQTVAQPVTPQAQQTIPQGQNISTQPVADQQVSAQTPSSNQILADQKQSSQAQQTPTSQPQQPQVQLKPGVHIEFQSVSVDASTKNTPKPDASTPPKGTSTPVAAYDHDPFAQPSNNQNAQQENQTDQKPSNNQTPAAGASTSVAPVTPTVSNVSAPNVSLPSSSPAPAVKILFPDNQALFHEEAMKIKYQLLNGNDQNTKVTVLIDGIRQPVNRAVIAANTVEVDLPKKDCSVMLMAQNQYGYGEPASIQLTWDKSFDNVVLPNLYVLSVGIGKYTDEKLPPLKYSVKDATDVAHAWLGKKGAPYTDVKVKLITDEQATRVGLFEGLTWLKENSTPNDVCIFFYAGHGFRDEKDRFYFVPIDGSASKTYSCFSAADFRTLAEDVRGKLVIFTDACYSAALMQGSRSAATDHFVEQLRRSKDGVFLLASSSSDTKSKEDDAWGNGAFTKALVEAINGAARHDTSTEGLTLIDLESYLDKRVGELTEHKQVPVAINPNGIENFSLFLYNQR